MNITDIREMTQKYKFSIVWTLDGVNVYKGGVNKEQINNLIELRSFNQEEELRIIKTNGEYIDRVKTDDDDEKYIDENHKLWGAFISFDGQNSTLAEDRGIRLILPIEMSEGQYAFITVRNYLDKKEFKFVDYRFVDIFAKEAKEYA